MPLKDPILPDAYCLGLFTLFKDYDLRHCRLRGICVEDGESNLMKVRIWHIINQVFSRFTNC